MSGAMMALINNNASSLIGPTPGSIYFPTTSSRVTLSPGIVVGGTYQSPFTVEGWFYCGDSPGTNSGPVLLSTTTGSGTAAYARALTINVSSSTQIIVDSNGAAATAFDFAQTITVGAWYYLAVSRDTSGFMQAWLGEQGDASAVASSTGRFDCSANTAAWALDGISDCIGAFVPANRFSADDNVSGVRVTNTNLYTTTDATISMPAETFGYVPGIRFLQSPNDLTDLTGNQTLTSVSSAAYSADGPSIAIQAYTALTIATNDSGGLTGWSSTALSIAYSPTVIGTYPVGSMITWQDGSTATIVQWDDYGPLYIDLFWDTPKTGTLFPITLSN